MKAKLFRISERMLLTALALAFLSPLAMTVIGNNPRHFKWSRLLHHPWIGNRTLGGVTVSAPDVPLSWRVVRTGDFQKSKANRFNEQFGGREALIRVTNEVWFRLFRDTASPTSTVAVGLNGTLFEKLYLREYFLQRVKKDTLAPWVNDLRQLQDFCRKIGMGFVVVVTPSKASIYPENTPLAWRRWYDPRPRAPVQLGELFRENGIVFVDGPALLAAEKLASASLVPFFPKGGSHWNSRAVWLVANAVQSRFREQDKPLGPMEVMESAISCNPEGDEADLVRLMNLARPWSYPCERLSVSPASRPETEQLTMAVVGGSFTWELIRQLSASRQFSEIDFYFYYKLYKTRAVHGLSSQVRAPGIPVDFDREIFAADCLLLEINEASALFPEHHLSAFLTDALAHLPDPSAERQPFRSDRYIHCGWDTEISFRAGDPNLFLERATTGFSSPEPEITWTDGRKAIIRFSVPDAKRDITLHALVGALVDDHLAPKQHAALYANDERLGVWEFDADQNDGLRSLTIPRRLIGKGGKIAVAFHIERPLRPKDLPPAGASMDARELGLRFRSMRLSQAEDAAAQN